MIEETTTYLESVEKGDKFELTKDEVTIGRAKGNDLHFNFIEISSKHAVFQKKGAQWSIKDLGSTNGTFINGREMKGESPLKNGDRIKFGRPEYIFHCPQPAGAAAASAPDKTVLMSSGPAADKTMVVGGAQPGAGKAGDVSITDFKRQFEKQPAAVPAAHSVHEQKTILEPTMHKASDADLDRTTAGGMGEMKTMIGGVAPVSAVGKAFAVLEEKSLSSRRKSFPLSKIENKIGCAAECDVCLDDKSVAPLHATIAFEARNRVMLRLLDNNFSLKVNGKFYKSQPLNTGDTVEIGELAYVYKLIQFPKFKERYGLLGRFKKVIAAAVLLLVVFGGLYAWQSKKAQQEQAKKLAEAQEKGPSADQLQAGLTPLVDIWGMIERQLYSEAESKIEKYFMLQEQTADGDKPYTPPQELNEASQAIDIFIQAQKMFEGAKFYDALSKLKELPAGRAQALELTNALKSKISSTLNEFADKEYVQGVRSFRQSDFATAQGHFEKALEFYPAYKDSQTYLERIQIALHYTKPLNEIKDLLKSNRIDRTLEVIDTLKEYDTQGLTAEAQADAKAFEETRATLLKHANIYMLYQSGQGKLALENFSGIPRNYSHYRDLEKLAEKIKTVIYAYEGAQEKKTKEAFDKVLTLEDNPNNFYHREAKKLSDELIKNLHAQSDRIIDEGRLLQLDKQELEALKKYYQALLVEPGYQRAQTLCESLAKDLLFKAYQLGPEQKREKYDIYKTIIDHTPKTSKINQDAQTQLDHLN